MDDMPSCRDNGGEGGAIGTTAVVAAAGQSCIAFPSAQVFRGSLSHPVHLTR
jgi:hypothetical protein